MEAKVKRAIKTTKYQIFEYWKDRTVDGRLLKETHYSVKEMVYDWGEPCCFGCNRWTGKDISDKGCESLAKLWNHRSVRLERAHIVPHALGGEDSPENLVLLCTDCHRESPDTIYKQMFFVWISEKRDYDSAQVWFNLVNTTIEMLGKMGYSENQINGGLSLLFDNSKGIINSHGNKIQLSSYKAAIVGSVIEANKEITDGAVA